MKKKFITCALIALSIVLAFSACGKIGGSKGSAKSSPKSAAAQILDEAQKKIGNNEKFPDYKQTAVTSKTSQETLGLSAKQFDKYVSEAVTQTPSGNAAASQISLAKCKSEKSAAETKKLIARNFNTNKWANAKPEQGMVVDSGKYVLLFAGTKAQASAIQDGFKSILKGKIGKANVFYKSDGKNAADDKSKTSDSATKDSKSKDKSKTSDSATKDSKSKDQSKSANKGKPKSTGDTKAKAKDKTDTKQKDKSKNNNKGPNGKETTRAAVSTR
jgi:hypothetical protein